MASLDEQLLGASRRGERKEVKRLLRAGARLEARNEEDQSTPLHLASMEGHEPVVSLLLGEGAVVDARDDLEFTPLHAASLEGHAAVVALLAEGGASYRCPFEATPCAQVREGHSGG